MYVTGLHDSDRHCDPPPDEQWNCLEDHTIHSFQCLVLSIQFWVLTLSSFPSLHVSIVVTASLVAGIYLFRRQDVSILIRTAENPWISDFLMFLSRVREIENKYLPLEWIAFELSRENVLPSSPPSSLISVPLDSSSAAGQIYSMLLHCGMQWQHMQSVRHKAKKSLVLVTGSALPCPVLTST